MGHGDVPVPHYLHAVPEGALRRASDPGVCAGTRSRCDHRTNSPFGRQRTIVRGAFGRHFGRQPDGPNG